MHIISSQKCTLYPRHRNAHFILFSDKHNIFSSQKCTLYPLPGKNTIFSSQKCTLYPLPGKSTISSSQKYTLYPLHRNAHYILFSEINIISSSQYKNYFSADKHNMSFSQIYTISSSQRNIVSSFQVNTLYLLP